MVYKTYLTGPDDPNFAEVAKKYEAEVNAAGKQPQVAKAKPKKVRKKKSAR